MPLVLGDLIKRRRAELGMTQSRLAELVGMSASAVRSWERGRAAPKDESTRAALAAVLGVSDEELVAAIDGTEISFFSDPGRPIVADPTPTIVQPEVVSESLSEAAPSAAEADGEGLETTDEETNPDSADQSTVVEAPPVEAEVDIAHAEPGDETPADTVQQPATENDVELRQAESPAADRPPSITRQQSGGGLATRLVQRGNTGSRPAAILAPARVVELDPVARDAWLYRRRLILLAVGVIALLAVLRWALGGVGDAFGEVLNNLRTGA